MKRSILLAAFLITIVVMVLSLFYIFAKFHSGIFLSVWFLGSFCNYALEKGNKKYFARKRGWLFSHEEEVDIRDRSLMLGPFAFLTNIFSKLDHRNETEWSRFRFCVLMPKELCEKK